MLYTYYNIDPINDHSNSILNTSHSFVKNCPFGCPVNAKLDSGDRMYLPLL